MIQDLDFGMFLVQGIGYDLHEAYLLLFEATVQVSRMSLKGCN